MGAIGSRVNRSGRSVPGSSTRTETVELLATSRQSIRNSSSLTLVFRAGFSNEVGRESVEATEWLSSGGEVWAGEMRDSKLRPMMNGGACVWKGVMALSISGDEVDKPERNRDDPQGLVKEWGWGEGKVRKAGVDSLVAGVVG